MELWVATAVIGYEQFMVIGVYSSQPEAIAARDRFIARVKLEYPVRTDDPDAYYISDVERVILDIDGVQPD